MTETLPPTSTATRRLRRGERGLAVATTALVLVPLMTFAAFGVDLASWYNRAGQLQRAADAAALAGAVRMPQIAQARTEATNNLQSNGFVSGTDGITAVIEPGSTATALRVRLIDSDVEQYFSRVFRGGAPTLTREAEAEYNLPLPLGSPLNYFGGDATRVDPGSTAVTTYTLAWPTPNRSPVATPCNNGTSAAQNLGGWVNSTTQTSSHSASLGQCTWQIQLSGSTVDHNSVSTNVEERQAPTNAPCNRRPTASSGNGRWESATVYNASQRYTSGTGNRDCLWRNATNLPANYSTTNPATNRASGCNVPGFGRWNGDTWQAEQFFLTGTGNRLCEFGPTITSSTVNVPNPNPINSGRSPGFWAAIEGPRTRAVQGDAYSTRCWGSTSCSSVQNAMFSTGSNRGYWYVVQTPGNFPSGGSFAINVFDASFVHNDTVSASTGDRRLDINPTVPFPTQFQVYRQTNPLDFNARTQLWSVSTPNQTAGSCSWAITSQAAFEDTWMNLCNITSAGPNQTYLINVQTTGDTGDGVNGYALEAVRGCTSLSPVTCAHGGIQPALYAFSSMQMQNNNFCGGTGPACPPPPATFYLAEVGPQYAGRTLVMELWDPGDVSGTATLTPMMPSATLPRPVVEVPSSLCTYTSDHAPNASITGLATPVPTATRPAGTACTITTASSGTSRFQGLWLRIRIDIPPTYTCNDADTVNPEVDPNTCWWGIRYSFSSSANDVTTWQARVEGNPLQLTE